MQEPSRQLLRHFTGRLAQAELVGVAARGRDRQFGAR